MQLAEMLLCTDYREAQALLYDSRFRALVVSDGATETPLDHFPGAVQASILLPPYEAVAALLDGQYQAFQQMYWAYLASVEVDTFLTCVVRAMQKGINMILYTSEEEYRLGFMAYLIGYIQQNFGISPAIPGESVYMYNPAFDWVNISKIYGYDLMNAQEFFLLYPPNVGIPDFILPQLVAECRPYVSNMNMQSYKQYFEQHIANTHRLGKNLIIPATRGGVQQ